MKSAGGERGRGKEWNLDASVITKDWMKSREWERETVVRNQRTEP